MNKEHILAIVTEVLEDYCLINNLDITIEESTPLIGENRILDSMGLVNIIVDIETSFLEKNVELNLTSETAMSARISPFRSVGSLTEFINKQINKIE